MLEERKKKESMWMEQNELFENSQLLSLIFTIQIYCSWSYGTQSKSKNTCGETFIKIDN